ncbi:HEPN domain-containing protein [Aquipseudomonas alcaligenes]|uniref:HEPN domain-containing protein n=1 Tax=Aquipseudomonas alcaligenes TaxID=43263 RepID=UPI0035AE609A
MRKISPQDVRDDFVTQISDLRNFYQAGFAGFVSDKDRSTLTEHSLLAAAVAWEGFVSDLFIAYINVDASRFKTHLVDSFNEHVKAQDKPNRVFQKYGKLQLPNHLSKADVQSLANGSGSNITFRNFDELVDRAAVWLIQAHADRFRNITAPQKALINSVISLRNHVAHRSQRSLDAMNTSLAVGALHTTGIKRLGQKFHNVGAWLKATPVRGTEPRILTIFTNLEVIGAAC